MKGLRLIILTVSLLIDLGPSALALYSQDHTAESCTSKDIRQAAVDKLLTGMDCDNYECALNKVFSLGLTPSNPAINCREIFNKTLSGYYWLKSDNGSAVSVFCDMSLTCKGVGGGWMQVIKLDMTNRRQQCPPGTRLRTDLPKRLCGSNLQETDSGCSSTIIDVHGIQYEQVCGKIIAYQDGSPDAFGARNQITRSNNIDENYVDGTSLSRGNNPREHIWTFAGALDELGEFERWNAYCPCTNINFPASASQPPSFVGNDYFCDTASENHFQHIFYSDDPLWDGAGCGQNNTCCALNNPPWFLKQLPSSTTDDIEMRICRDQGNGDEGTPFETIELYVR